MTEFDNDENSFRGLANHSTTKKLAKNYNHDVQFDVESWTQNDELTNFYWGH